jgi:hypothetical protein
MGICQQIAVKFPNTVIKVSLANSKSDDYTEENLKCRKLTVGLQTWEPQNRMLNDRKS